MCCCTLYDLFLVSSCAVLCSDDPPDAFATSSLHVDQRKSLHDDIMPEVAEELGPGAQCMVAHPLVLIHFQHTHTHTHTHARTHTHTCAYLRTHMLTLRPDLDTPVHTLAHNDSYTYAHLYSHAVQRP